MKIGPGFYNLVNKHLFQEWAFLVRRKDECRAAIEKTLGYQPNYGQIISWLLIGDIWADNLPSSYLIFKISTTYTNYLNFHPSRLLIIKP